MLTFNLNVADALLLPEHERTILLPDIDADTKLRQPCINARLPQLSRNLRVYLSKNEFRN